MSKSLKLFVLFAFTLIGFFSSLVLGSVMLTGEEIFKALLFDETTENSHSIILYSLRLPRTILAMTAGASLAVCGLLMQTYFRNPLAGPGILGISSAASLGAAISILLGQSLTSLFLPTWMESASLFAFSLLFCLGYTFLLFIGSHKFFSPLGLLLMGVMASYFINALISIFMSISKAEGIRRFVYWGFGSFEGVSHGKIVLSVFFLLMVFIMVIYHSKGFNAFLLGEESALSLGINTQVLRYVSIGATCLVTALVTSICGPIGFIGLAGPHLARLVMRTSNHQWLAGACIFSGATLALWSDIIARLPGVSGVLPVNAVLSLLGAPLIIVLILKQE